MRPKSSLKLTLLVYPARDSLVNDIQNSHSTNVFGSHCKIGYRHVSPPRSTYRGGFCTRVRLTSRRAYSRAGIALAPWLTPSDARTSGAKRAYSESSGSPANDAAWFAAMFVRTAPVDASTTAIPSGASSIQSASLSECVAAFVVP